MTPDRSVIRAVVGFLGAIALLLTTGLLLVMLRGEEVSEAVLALVSAQLGATVGALGAILANTHTWAPYGDDEDKPATGNADDPIEVHVNPS